MASNSKNSSHVLWFVCLCCCAILLSFALACSKSAAPEQPAAKSRAPATPLDPATVANVSGTVKFAGPPPKLIKIDMSNDPGCKGENESEQVVTEDGHLGNVLVYVKD